MPTVDYQPIANGGGANVESQASYLVDLAPGGSLQNGFVSGLAHSNQFNKVARQSSMVTAAVANFVSNTLAVSVLDDGDLAALIAKFTSAISLVAGSGAWSTGDVKITMKTGADAGWVFCNDGTIGDASSGASNRANADCQALFLLLWTNCIDTWAPVPGGRGGSAAADWAAHKKITLTKMLGRALALSGAGFGLSARALGENLGEETHTLNTAEMPSHNHAITDPGHLHTSIIGGAINEGSGASGQGITSGNTGTSTTGITVNNTGGGGAHANMQPTSFVNAMVKL